jgi:hypothetical protein
VSDQLLKTEDLMEWAEIYQRPALIQWLDAKPYPIPYKVTKKGVICTTLAAVTEALRQREDSDTWAA